MYLSSLIPFCRRKKILSLFSVYKCDSHDPIFRIWSSVEQMRGEQCKGEQEEKEQWWSPREVEFFWVKEISSLTGGGRGRASLGIQEGRKNKNRNNTRASISFISRPREGVTPVHLESHGLEGIEKDAYWPSHFHCHLSNQLLPPDTLDHTSHMCVSHFSWAAA